MLFDAIVSWIAQLQNECNDRVPIYRGIVLFVKFYKELFNIYICVCVYTYTHTYIKVPPPWISVYHVCTGASNKQEDVEFLELDLQVVASCHVGTWVPTQVLLQEQQVFLTSEPSLQFLYVIFLDINIFFF